MREMNLGAARGAGFFVYHELITATRLTLDKAFVAYPAIDRKQGRVAMPLSGLKPQLGCSIPACNAIPLSAYPFLFSVLGAFVRISPTSLALYTQPKWGLRG